MCIKQTIETQKNLTIRFNQNASLALITTLFSQMNVNVGHRRVSDGYGHHSLGKIHTLIPKLHPKKKDVVVEDLSEKLIPIIGGVKFAAVIHNLFTPQECAELIKVTERKGYDNALIQGPNGSEILRKDIRNSGRCIIDDERLAQAWYDRMIQALEGSTIKDRIFDEYWLEDHEDGGSHRSLRAVGLNERLRFLRYHPGQYFSLHRDNSYVRGKNSGSRAGEESHLTFLLYLNGKMEGGQTRIQSSDRYMDVVPETGAVLVFDHDILHQAVEITSGSKYCCRTDVMFAVKEPVIEQEEPAKLQLSENVWASQVKSVKRSPFVRF